MKNWKTYLYLILTYVVMHVSSVFLAKFLFQHFGKNPDLTEKEALFYGFAWSQFSVNVIAVLLFVFFIVRHKKFLHVFKGKPGSTGNAILWGFLGFFLALLGQMVAGMIEDSLFGIEAGSENTALLSDIAKISPIIIFSMVLFAPFLEEIIFRRVLFGGLYQKTNFIIATLVSAVVFAAVHGELEHLLIYMAPAFVFAYIYYRTKRLLAPIIAHMLMNGFVVIIQLNADKIMELQKIQQSIITFFQ